MKAFRQKVTGPVSTDPVKKDSDSVNVDQPTKAVHFPEDDVLNQYQEDNETWRHPDDEAQANNNQDENDNEDDNSLEDRPLKPSVFHRPETKVTDNLNRRVILEWINDLMESNLKKIEELGTGVMYCLIMNRLFPGSVALDKIKYHTKKEAAYIQNFRVLQTAFKGLLMSKVIPIHKLVKCRFTDNFEFVQWFKKFFDVNFKDQKPYGYLRPLTDSRTSSGSTGGSNMLADMLDSNGEIPVKTFMNPARPSHIKCSPKMDHLHCQLADVKLNTRMVTMEKDFYFKKMQEIEDYLHEQENFEHREDIQTILGILYVTQDGFGRPTEGDDEAEKDQWDDWDED